MTFLALAYLIGFTVSVSMAFAAGEATSTAASIGAFTFVSGAVLALLVVLL